MNSTVNYMSISATSLNSATRSGSNGVTIIDFPVILLFTASGILVLAYAYTCYKIHVMALIMSIFASLTGIICLVALRSRYMDPYYIPFALFHVILFTVIACKTTLFFYQALKEFPDDDPKDAISPEQETNPTEIFEMAEGH